MKNLPTIHINNKKYTMIIPKAKMWRVWTKFDSDKVDLQASDFIDKHCELIAQVFPPLTADDLIENLELDEVLKLYNECFLALTKMLSSKLEIVEKNVEKDEVPD